MRVRDLDYELPPELIAQTPLSQRDRSRLLVYERATREVRHRRFADLPCELDADDLVVLNDTRVMPARLRLQRSSGGDVEILLIERRVEETWEALARPSRRLRVGERLSASTQGSPVSPHVPGGFVELLEQLRSGHWIVRVVGSVAGEAPLPPYIHERLNDAERYQTVYASSTGSVAAPTASLHVTPTLLERLDHVFVTLHVGVDTFRPIVADSLEEHPMHGERYSIEAAVWARVTRAERVVALGTTTVRALEAVAASADEGREPKLAGRTELMISPGHRFRAVDALVTNFHLPRSTLLGMVMALVGRDEALHLHELAIRERYRFYSFGDAMLIL